MQIMSTIIVNSMNHIHHSQKICKEELGLIKTISHMVKQILFNIYQLNFPFIYKFICTGLGLNPTRIIRKDF